MGESKTPGGKRIKYLVKISNQLVKLDFVRLISLHFDYAQDYSSGQ